MIGKFFYDNRLTVLVMVIILSLIGHHYLTTQYGFEIGFRPKNTDVVQNRPAPSTPVDPHADQPSTPYNKPAIRSWAYYIKDPQLDKIRNSNFDLVVTDTGSDTIKRFSRAQIEELKESGSGKRIIAYLSLGAAENYRGYWKAEWNKLRPEWMREENKLFKGNFRVEDLLHPEWMQISKNLIDDVMNAGFDGIMINGLNSPQVAQYLEKISAHAKGRNSQFTILVQDYVDPAIADYVDGIVKQNIYYFWGLNERNNVRTTLEKMRDFINRDKIVLAVSYTTGHRWDKTKYALKAEGIVPYSGPRQLDHLRTEQ